MFKLFSSKKEAPKKYFYFIAYVAGPVFGNTLVESKVLITNLDTIKYLEDQIAQARQKEGNFPAKEKIIIISFTPL